MKVLRQDNLRLISKGSLPNPQVRSHDHEGASRLIHLIAGMRILIWSSIIVQDLVVVSQDSKGWASWQAEGLLHLLGTW